MSPDSWEALGDVHVQAKEDKNSHYLVKKREGMEDLQLLGTGLSHGVLRKLGKHWDQFVLTRV